MRKRAALGLVILGALLGILLASAVRFIDPPAQTATASIPKAQPVPTFTPTPVRGPDDYAQAAAERQQMLAAALVRVGALVGAPRLDDANWRAEVATAMQEVEAAYGTLLGLQAPEPWQAFHRRLLSGAADCNAAMRVLALALDERQPATVGVVAALLGRCEAALHAAQDLVNNPTRQPETKP